MKTTHTPNSAAWIALAIVTTFAPAQAADDTHDHVDATRTTAQANAAVADALPLANKADFEAAERGLIARDPDLVIKGDDGAAVWDMPAYDFIQGDAPDTVNPSLWRQAKLNNKHGLYKVTDRIYQLRGYDLSNMTLIEGDSGWIVIDPLITAETASAAWEMAKKHIVDDKPIVAVIFTHSHIDHFGGIEGVLSAERAKQNDVRIIAPKGFMAESTSENLLAGPAMGRRATYMFGGALERSPRGHVDSGLGKAPAQGHFSILAPTDTIDHTGQTLTIDGLEFEFQYAPEAEAPAELTFYLPELKAFCGAEIVTRNMHNLYTLRGAKVRDALKWSGYIDEALQLFGDRVEVLFASHHWPTWGHDKIVDYLKIQRDTYKYIHDQTLRLANAGYTPREIAERIALPDSLAKPFHNRGYYGTVSHNSKAVYQWYFGWFDGNPANLNPLPPAESATKYVEFMGGANAVLDKAQRSYESGEYRWTAEVLNHVVFAKPDNEAATSLLAKTYDQLGYRAESGPWRDFYLTGAKELREGAQGTSLDMRKGLGLLRQVPIDRIFDAMAARLNGPKAADADLTVNFDFTDLGENHVLQIENAVLHHWRRPAAEEALAARVLGKQQHMHTLDELFLAALLQDIGRLALDAALPGHYAATQNTDVDHNALIALEREQLATDHLEAGAWVLREWRLPEYLPLAVWGSHDRSRRNSLGDLSSFVSCVAVSGLIADIYLATDAAVATAVAQHVAAACLGLTAEDLGAVLGQLVGALPEIEVLFETPVLSAVQAEGLTEQAQELIACRNLKALQVDSIEQSREDELKKIADQLYEVAHRDALTGVFNRRHFDEALTTAFTGAGGNRQPLSLAYLDLDRFKAINDQHGHMAGDTVLVAVAAAIQGYLRPTDLLARYGGEEFVILLPGLDRTAAKAVVERIRAGVEGLAATLANG